MIRNTQSARAFTAFPVICPADSVRPGGGRDPGGWRGQTQGRRGARGHQADRDRQVRSDPRLPTRSQSMNNACRPGNINVKGELVVEVKTCSNTK